MLYHTDRQPIAKLLYFHIVTITAHQAITTSKKKQNHHLQDSRFEVRGSAWVIAKRRASQTADAGTLLSRDSHELHMMTSATLIEALYECVQDWLQQNSNKTNLLELDDKDD